MELFSAIIGGDLVATKSNMNNFVNGDINKIVDKRIIDELNSVDFRLFNLEVPLTDKVEPIIKLGPNLIASTNAIQGIKKLNPSLLCIANNHIMDQGEQGLFSTINLLDQYNIDYVGAGENLTKAYKPYIIEKAGKRIGIYACAEHEFTIATDEKAGANPFDSLESLDHIYNLKQKCDYVIVLYHGGKEHYRYPSPYLQKVCRKIVEKGADLVICQHSHCIGAFEQYKDSTIVYGQGNFLFDLCDDECWKTGLLIKILFGEKMAVQYIPILKNKNGITKAINEEKNKILEAFYERSNKICERNFIYNEYNKFTILNGEYYLYGFAGYNKFKIKLDQLFKGKIIKSRYNIKKLVELQNFIECEAHRELILNLINEKKSK